MVWNRLNGFRIGTVNRFFQHFSEPFCSIKCREFCDQLSSQELSVQGFYAVLGK